MAPKLPIITPQEEPLAAHVRRYRAHNDRLAEKLSMRVQVSTIADLEIIVRQTHHSLDRAIRRIRRLEERVGIPDTDERSEETSKPTV